MEKIQELLAKLDNKVTASIKRKLSGLTKLNEKLALAKAEHQANPTDESSQNLVEIEDYIGDVTEEIIEHLEDFLESRTNASKDMASSKVLEAKKIEDDESSNGTWGMIFGVVLLVGTFGVINILKNNK